MKRYIIVILTFLLILPISVNAKDLSGDNVTLNNCVDGNSARFMLGVNEILLKRANPLLFPERNPTLIESPR